MPEVMEKYDSSIVSDEVWIGRLHRLAREHFQLTIKNDYDYLHSVKESVRFFSLDLPQEIKEIFIPYREAPIFWIYESHLLNQVEEFMKFNFVKGSVGELHKSIKENYTKWVTTKLKSEKDYYATTTVNFIERDVNKHNFFKCILKAIIHTYQPSFYSLDAAVELLKVSLETIESLRMNDQAKSELKYILHLYKGFAFLKGRNYMDANLSFKDAIDVKNHGCTAKIYSAFTELQLNHEDIAAYLLNEVMAFDTQRLTMSIKASNAGMFSYFFRNAFIYNIFHEREFAKALGSIEKMLSQHRVDDLHELARIKSGYDSLKTKNYDEYYDEDIKKSLTFIDKMIAGYSNNTNTLLISVMPVLKEKFASILESINANIRKKYYTEVQSKLSTYDSYIQENQDMEKKLHDELEKFKERSKETLKESIQRVTENFEAEIKIIEDKIHELPNLARFSPQVSMSNNMSYNMIIAFIVFFIGGVSGYSNRTVADTAEFNSIFSYVLISGFKWGTISFIIGTLLSIIISGVKVIERHDYNKRLLNRINALKYEKERTVADLKDSTAQKERIMHENINNSIAHHRKRVDELRAQRSETEKGLLAKADEEIARVAQPLLSLM